MQDMTRGDGRDSGRVQGPDTGDTRDRGNLRLGIAAAVLGAALAGGGIGAGAFWLWSGRKAAESRPAAGAGEAGAAAADAVGRGGAPGALKAPGKAMYTCAMHPSYLSDKPGNCPICGMALVPAAGHAHGGGGRSVVIDSVTLRNMGVRTAKVEKRELAPEIRTSGKIAVDEARQVSVNARVGGWVERLRASATGRTVRKGEILLELYSPELTGTQEEYLQALRYAKGLETQGAGAASASASGEAAGSARRAAGELVESARRRLLNWGVPEQSIRDLERDGSARRTVPVLSPSHGVILEKRVIEGQKIEPGMPLYRIADLSKVWVVANAYQGDLARVKVGASAGIALSYLPGKTFTGRVAFVSPVLDPDTRTAEVRIEVANTAALDLKPEMFATVILKAASGGPVVAVPEQAVIRSGRRDIAVVALGEGAFEPRDVKLGAAADGYVQVLEGLEVGESLVVSSQFLIDSESNLKAAIEQMQKPDQAAP
jgi:Cu(I)/Ag(I) efflux system membrane fusion protein